MSETDEASSVRRTVARILELASQALASGDVPLAVRRMHNAQEQIATWREMVIEDALAARSPIVERAPVVVYVEAPDASPEALRARIAEVLRMECGATGVA